MNNKIEEKLEPGYFMTTFTGRKVWPLQIKKDDIHILDIAHALANTCRYNGHTSPFYSVAEHCVLLARSKFPGMPKWKLMHDAAEAYIGDMVWRMKKLFPKFTELEAQIDRVIAERFDLPPYEGEIKDQVKIGDKEMLWWEGNTLMLSTPGTYWTEMEKPKIKVEIRCWTPLIAEVEFISEFRRLFNG